MSHNLHKYSVSKTIYFKVTKDGEGVSGLTFQDADIELSKDGSNWADITASSNVTEVEVGAGYGVYEWTPSTAQATCEVMILNIKDAVGTDFDENCLIILTGGHDDAFFDG